jgi:hypothetical protein
LAEAESLVSKVETGPADSYSEEIRKMKLDLTTCGSLLKSHLKTAQRYGLAPEKREGADSDVLNRFSGIAWAQITQSWWQRWGHGRNGPLLAAANSSST